MRAGRFGLGLRLAVYQSRQQHSECLHTGPNLGWRHSGIAKKNCAPGTGVNVVEREWPDIHAVSGCLSRDHTIV